MMKFLTTMLMSLSVVASTLAADRLQSPAAGSTRAEAQMANKRVEIITDNYEKDWTYYDDTQDWWASIKSKDQLYTIYLDILTNELIGEYTIDDLNLKYAFGQKIEDDGALTSFLFNDAQITITQGELEDFYDVDATLSTNIGETLHVVVKRVHKEIHVESKELEVVTYYAEDNDWSFRFADEDYRVSLDLINYENPGHFAHSYTIDDCIEQFTNVTELATGKVYNFNYFEVETTGDEPSYECEITGWGELDNGDNITFHVLRKAPLEPKRTLDVSAKAEQILFNSAEHGGKSYISAISDDQKYRMFVTYSGTLGWIDSQSIDASQTGIVNLQTNETYAFDHGMVDVSLNKDNVLSFYSELICEDAINYVVYFSHQLDIKETVQIAAHDISVSGGYTKLYTIDGSTDEYPVIQGRLPFQPYPGSYASHMSFYLKDAAGNEVSSMLVKTADITLDEYDNLVLNASFLGNNSVAYELTMDYAIPAVAHEATFTSAAGKGEDHTSEGYVTINAQSEEDGSTLTLVFDMKELLPGDIDQLSSTHAKQCRLVLNAGTDSERTLIVYTCHVNFAVGGGKFVLKGECQAGDVRYALNIEGTMSDPDEGGSPYDDQYNDIEVFYTADQVTVDIDLQVRYALVEANDGKSRFSALFYIKNDKLVAGTYIIDDTYKDGTAQVGKVDPSENAVYPTSYVNLTASGSLKLPFWLCVAGTIEVSYINDEVSLNVNAYNTWGRKAHIVVNDPSAQAIHQLTTEQQRSGKVYDERGIVIVRGDKQFNAFGQMLR